MKYISSDTNIWIDFQTIGKLDLPFRLPYIYLMDDDAVRDELLSPEGLNDKLLEFGLKQTELSEDEFFLAQENVARFARLSKYDAIALAIAKVRSIILLTGDWALRKAAAEEAVDCIGTIGIIDQLIEGGYIEQTEYVYCLMKLQENNGGRIRLPAEELEKRIQKYNK